jgi:tripartite-type tricarboxylate transporter receptor subunit TctC
MLTAVACLLSFSSYSHAQAWPNSSITFVTPLAVGSASDVALRIVSEQISKSLGQSILIDNQTGASGAIGAEKVANANSNGSVFCGCNNAILSVLPQLRKVPYSPSKSFKPVGMVAVLPTVLVVNADSPFKTVKDIVDYAKANPDKLNYASSGAGAPQRMGAEIFQKEAGIKITHVPYKGSGPAMTDLVAGQVNMMVETVPAALPFITAGQLRPLAVTTAKRISMLPDVPTTAESGMPALEVSSTFGVLAPVGTSAAIIDRLNSAIAKLLVNPEVKEAFLKQGVYATMPTKPKQSAELLATEVKRWEKVIKDADIKPD